MKRREISRLENRQNANTLRKRKTQKDRKNIREENGHIKNTALMPTNKRCTSRGKHANLRLRQAEGLADSVIKRVLRRSVSSSESANWNLKNQKRSMSLRGSAHTDKSPDFQDTIIEQLPFYLHLWKNRACFVWPEEPGDCTTGIPFGHHTT